MSETLNLIQKLAKIRSISDVVLKEKKGYNYSYSDITTILANITAGMKKYGVSLIPSVVPGTFQVTPNVVVNTKLDRAGNAYEQTVTEMLVKADMVFKWVNDEHPEEFIEVPWSITGSQNDPSQAFGSGLTYCTRYFLTNYFQIAQADKDVDGYRSKQQAAEAAEDKAIAEGIIEQFDVILKQYLADNPERSSEVEKFISKFARKSNYFTIKEPVLASKLLNDFKNTFLNGEDK